jgi:uncharacterized protein YqkB
MAQPLASANRYDDNTQRIKAAAAAERADAITRAAKASFSAEMANNDINNSQKLADKSREATQKAETQRQADLQAANNANTNRSTAAYGGAAASQASAEAAAAAAEAVRLADLGINTYRLVQISRSSDGKDISWKDQLGPNMIAKNLELILEDDISFTINNTYEDPIAEILNAAKKTKVGSMVQGFLGLANFSSLFTNTRIMTKFTAAKAWKTSSQLSFSLRFNFYMGMAGEYSGKTEVYNPIRALGYIFLPRVTSGIQILGPGPSYSSMISDQGKVVYDALQKTVDGWAINFFGDDAAKQFDSIVNGIGNAVKGTLPSEDATGGGRIRLTVGKNNVINFSKILPMDFTYSFSKDLDSDGFPISGSCTIACETLYLGHAGSI